mmetsp:Transcript_10799/g.15816  ORF Transcript_10799/g.15816 Transcript_10799/m.15816 type:complete len:512 (+) Transcript_10799:72-1607(+)
MAFSSRFKKFWERSSSTSNTTDDFELNEEAIYLENNAINEETNPFLSHSKEEEEVQEENVSEEQAEIPSINFDHINELTSDAKIQVVSIYGKNGKACIDACFDDNGKPLFDLEHTRIEVPIGMKQDCVEHLESRLQNYLNPNVIDAKFSNEVILEGIVSYETACCIAQTGRIEGLSLLFYSNMPYTMMQSSITGIVVFAASIWQGDSIDEAFVKSCGAFLATFATGIISQAIIDQLKNSIGRQIAIPFAEALTHSFTQMFGEQFILSIGQLLNHGQAVTLNVAQVLVTDLLVSLTLSGVFTVALTGGMIALSAVPDVYRLAVNRISPNQFLKNLTINSISMTSGAVVGTAGGFGGAALGSLAGPAGTVVGGIVGGVVAGTGAGVVTHIVSKKIGDRIVKDDVILMFDILKQEFPTISLHYHLTEGEAKRVIKILCKRRTSRIHKQLVKMYQHGASGKSREDKMNLWTFFAYYNIIEPIIWSDIIPSRKFISFEEQSSMKKSFSWITDQTKN